MGSLQLCSADAEATAAWFARCLNGRDRPAPGARGFAHGSSNLFHHIAADNSNARPHSEQQQGIDHFGRGRDDLDAAFEQRATNAAVASASAEHSLQMIPFKFNHSFFTR